MKNKISVVDIIPITNYKFFGITFALLILKLTKRNKMIALIVGLVVANVVVAVYKMGQKKVY